MVVTGDDEETEYESDPEEEPFPATMRRREASDDEEVEGDEGETLSKMNQRLGIDSDVESDGQGGAPAYYDDDDESEVDEEDGIEDEYDEREVSDNNGDEVEVQVVLLESGGNGERLGEEKSIENRDENQGEGEKKENEPFAVPTAGAFYMHDDRFRANVVGRNRRTGGRRLWESKNDTKWGHDKFEEMNLHGTHFEKQDKKGHYRGRGKKHGVDRGYVGGNRSQSVDDNNNINHAQKTVRGRGPRRYGSQMRNRTDASPTQSKQYGNSHEMTLNTNSSGKLPNRSHTSNVKSDAAAARKVVLASSLSSASPPFYPSGSSNQDVLVKPKMDVQVGSSKMNLSPAQVDGIVSLSPSSSFPRGKSITEIVAQGRLYIDENTRPVVGRLTNLKLKSSGSSLANSTQSLQSMAIGRRSDITGQLSYQPTSSHNPVNRGSPQTQPLFVQQKHVIPLQSAGVSNQQLGQYVGRGSQSSSAHEESSNISLELVLETESAPDSSKSKTASVSEGRGNVKGSSRGPSLHNGTRVIEASGDVGVPHGDQNFMGTPALLPVMQFGGQHPGGSGVQAVGMALPGYVGQPRHGFGNSEMTWVPVLAGANGALGAPYCSPFIAVEGGYYGHPSEQTSSSGASTDVGADKLSSCWKPPQRTELVNDEFGQRQNRPRRYSEMNFGQ